MPGVGLAHATRVTGAISPRNEYIYGPGDDRKQPKERDKSQPDVDGILSFVPRQTHRDTYHTTENSNHEQGRSVFRPRRCSSSGSPARTAQSSERYKRQRRTTPGREERQSHLHFLLPPIN
jgi:hypothetical protein